MTKERSIILNDYVMDARVIKIRQPLIMRRTTSSNSKVLVVIVVVVLQQLALNRTIPAVQSFSFGSNQQQQQQQQRYYNSRGPFVRATSGSNQKNNQQRFVSVPTSRLGRNAFVQQSALSFGSRQQLQQESTTTSSGNQQSYTIPKKDYTRDRYTLTKLFTSRHQHQQHQEIQELLKSSLLNDTHNSNHDTNNFFGTSQMSVLDIEGTFVPVIQDVFYNVTDVIDNVTDGWGLSYADLSPDNTGTVAGQTFLASNMAYFVAGALLTVTGDFWFGFCTELCAVASFNYHYQQLINSGSTTSPTVRLALLVDYLFAMLSILTALVYILTSPQTDGLPIYGIAISVVACICLGLSWVWEYGKPYMFWHSLWHLFSAYAGYVVGTEHYFTKTPPL